MKKLLFVFMLLSSTMFSQGKTFGDYLHPSTKAREVNQLKSDYPKIETDSMGIKVVIMTIEQAQKIDNNLDVLTLLEKAGVQCDSLNKAYLKVIDNLGKQVSILELDVKKLKDQIKDKDLQISNLQDRLNNESISNGLCEEQKNKKDEEIKLLKKEVRKQKRQKVVGFIVGGLAAAGGVFLLIAGI